jgi:hypothetical protein
MHRIESANNSEVYGNLELRVIRMDLVSCKISLAMNL